MPQYYSFQKGKFGSAAGTIMLFPRSFVNSNEYDQILPAGYLRCDGSVLSADLYRSLADVIGVGDNCIYKKDSVILQNPNDDGTGGQIQLPDLGSKQIQAGTTNGNLLLTASATEPTSGIVRERVGIGTELELVQGDNVDVFYTGNFAVPRIPIPITGNYLMDIQTQSSISSINQEQLLTHGHYVNMTRLVDQDGQERDYAFRGPNIPGDDQPGDDFGINIIEQEQVVVDSEGQRDSTEHEHTLQRTNPTGNTAVEVRAFSLNGESLITNVELASEDTIAFNDVTQRFILVEYLIKY